MSKQQSKMNDIQGEIDLTKKQLEENVIKIQERGELMDHLQTKTGKYSFSVSLTLPLLYSHT